MSSVDWSGANWSASPWAPSSQNRSFLGTLAHIPTQTVEDLANAAINSPAGLWHLGGGLIHHPLDTAKLIGEQTLADFEHPLRHPGFTLLDVAGLYGGVGAVAGRLGEAGAVLARAGELPKALEGATTLKAAEELGRGPAFRSVYRGKEAIPAEQKSVASQVARALIHGPPLQERLLTTTAGTVEHGWWYSKNPAIKAAQQLVDKAYNAFPENTPPPIWRVLPPFWHSQAGRIASARKAQEVVIANTERAEAGKFLGKFGKAPDAMHLAVRMVAEGTTGKVLSDMHQKWINSGVLTPKMIAESQRRINLIPEAEKYLETKRVTLPSGMEVDLPTPAAHAPPEFHDYVDKAREISKKREAISELVGILHEDSKISRIAGPLNFSLFGDIPPNVKEIARKLQTSKNLRQAKNVTKYESALSEAMGQLSLEDMIPAENKKFFTGEDSRALMEDHGLFRVPYKLDRGPLIDFATTSFRRAWKGGPKKPPSTYTHPFTAGILKHGGGEANIAKLLAESYTEAHRFVGFKANRDRILAASHATPEGIPEQYRQLIRTDENIFGGVPAAMRVPEISSRASREQHFLDQEVLSGADSIKAGRLYEGMRQRIFPSVEDAARTLAMIPERGAELAARLFRNYHNSEFTPVPGYRWIDKRLLGGLDKPNPLWGLYENKFVMGLIRGADTINNVQKAMLLYLKPAYAFPNMLGSLAMNLIQQGFLAPWNLARSFRIFSRLDESTIKTIRAAMGEGVAESGLQARGVSGLVYKSSRFLSKAYGKLIDEPFRFAAFLHEARLQGYVTNAEIHDLVHDPDLRGQFEQVANRANDEIINYERLGPGEQAVLRRLVFFYPWVKGSTRYVNYLLKNHPVAAGLAGVAGQQGSDYISRVLGELPSYEEGLIPYSTRNKEFPEVGNPASFAVLQEPAELTKKLLNIVQQNPRHGLALVSNLAPADAALLTLLTGGSETTLPHPAGERAVVSAAHELYGGNPIASLVNSLRGRASSGVPLESSLFPDPSMAHAILRFALLGGLTPRRYDKELGDWRAWLEANPTGSVGG